MDRICKTCGNVLTEDNRMVKEISKKGTPYYLNRCKNCLKESDTLLRKLKKDNPRPPSGTPCECCGRIDKLFCDHDHGNGRFRGWVCKNCNSGLGLLGDSREGLKQALAYLERPCGTTPTKIDRGQTKVLIGQTMWHKILPLTNPNTD